MDHGGTVVTYGTIGTIDNNYVKSAFYDAKIILDNMLLSFYHCTKGWSYALTLFMSVAIPSFSSFVGFVADTMRSKYEV